MKREQIAALVVLAACGTGSACGYVCHTRVKANDFVFTKYAPR